MKSTIRPRLFTITVIFIFLAFVFSISFHFNPQQKIIDNENILNLKTSVSSGRIHINNNWTAAKNLGICKGSGTSIDPYIIENLNIVTYPESGILIENSNYYIIIQNCSIGHAGFYNAGIELVNVSNSQILDNDCSFNYYGILLKSCDNITVLRNKVSDNQNYGYTLATGISIINTNNSIISQNIANYSGESSFVLSHSFDNVFEKNIANNGDSDDGIVLIDSENNFISENTANNNGIYALETFGVRFANGIHVEGGRNNILKDNTAINNANAGIVLAKSEHNLILGNLIKQNYEGILLVHESNENYVVSNTITKNDQHGIYLTRESNNNLIFKNEILENAICIEEDDCNGNLYWDNGLCIYYGAPFFLIIIFGSLGVVCITILVLLEIKRRRTHRF